MGYDIKKIEFSPLEMEEGISIIKQESEKTYLMIERSVNHPDIQKMIKGKKITKKDRFFITVFFEDIRKDDIEYLNNISNIYFVNYLISNGKKDWIQSIHNDIYDKIEKKYISIYGCASDFIRCVD